MYLQWMYYPVFDIMDAYDGIVTKHLIQSTFDPNSMLIILGLPIKSEDLSVFVLFRIIKVSDVNISVFVLSFLYYYFSPSFFLHPNVYS